jgi:uncharacterized membrane protein YeaQ/YmgE (transglycosylase-associated protein family)
MMGCRLASTSANLQEHGRTIMAPMLADIALMPGGIIAWMVVGLIAGWLAGVVMKGDGYGLLGDLVVGLVGALVGGFFVGLIDQGVAGFWGSIFVAFLGACIFIAIARSITGRRLA